MLVLKTLRSRILVEALPSRARTGVSTGVRSLSRGTRPLSFTTISRFTTNKTRLISPLTNGSIGTRLYSDDAKLKEATLKVDPQMMIAFTCKKCNTRSSHTFSKQAYTKGTVAIQCPGCKNRHLIADNLKIFKDNKFSLEDVLKARGETMSTTTDDLVFNDIPDSLKKTIGHHAKDAPEEYQDVENDVSNNGLPESQVSVNNLPKKN